MIVKIQEKEYRNLKAKADIVEEIKEESTCRDRLNFIVAHLMIGAGVAITVVTRLF